MIFVPQDSIVRNRVDPIKIWSNLFSRFISRTEGTLSTLFTVRSHKKRSSWSSEKTERDRCIRISRVHVLMIGFISPTSEEGRKATYGAVLP